MKKGFSLIEIIIAIALAAVFFPALVQIYSLSLMSASQGEKFSRALSLAQEQMEAVYAIKTTDAAGWDWTVKPENTAPGEYYQPQRVAGVWQLGTKTTTPAELDGFTRTVAITEIRRDPGNHSISADPLAPVDDYSRLVTVYISWSENSKPQSVTLESLMAQR